MSLSGGYLHFNYLLSSEAFKYPFDSFSRGNDYGEKLVIELKSSYGKPMTKYLF